MKYRLTCLICGERGTDLIAMQEHAFEHGYTSEDHQQVTRRNSLIRRIYFCVRLRWCRLAACGSGGFMTRCRNQPCATCPYRRDVPSGLWAATEYAKLPEYDQLTANQPIVAFFCHTSPEFLCTGWAVCHENRERGRELLALRLIEGSYGQCIEIPETTVPLFTSGRAAARHGMRDIDKPSRRAILAIRKLAVARTRAAKLKKAAR